MGKLKNQIKEEYGRVTYTYTAYHKMSDRNIKLNSSIKIIQIILTAVSATGFLATIITDRILLSWIGGGAVVLSLFLNIYTKDFRLLDEAQTYRNAANELWLIRQKYISLLCDFDSLTDSEIRKIRDALQENVDDINKKYPGTSSYGYKKAKKALEKQEEQFFSDEELSQMLPKELRY